MISPFDAMYATTALRPAFRAAGNTVLCGVPLPGSGGSPNI